MKTKRGIYYDLSESSYKFIYDEIEFYFSSETYLNKFKDSFIAYIKNETLKLSSKYKTTIEADYFLLITLYKSIEKRGFRVLYKNKKLDLIPYVTFRIEV